MRIDFHTHIFPDKIAANALQHLVDNTKAYEHLYGPATPHTNATAEGLLSSSREAGLDYSLVLPIATSPRPTPTINDFAATVNTMEGLRSFGSVHPLNPAFEEEIRRIKSLGLRGIKLHPEYQGCFVDDAETIAVVKAAADCGLWVIFHAGADIGMPPPLHCTPERICRLRQAVPQARIILAHMGGYLVWENVLRSIGEMDVYIDTSFCIPNHPEQHALFAKIIRTIGPERVLFGTDSPWADQKSSLQATELFLQEYGFTAEETEAILGGNAAHILLDV